MNKFITSLLLGIAYCAPPGIITAETIRRGASRGFPSAFLTQLGSIIGDLVWALIALTGSELLFQNIFTRKILTVLEVILLIYLAYISFRDFLIKTKLTESRRPGQNDFIAGMILSLSNPLAVAFWAGASTMVLNDFTRTPQQTDLIMFLLAFTLGTLIWSIFFSILVAWGRAFMTVRFFRLLNIFCGFVFLYFSLQLGHNLLF